MQCGPTADTGFLDSRSQRVGVCEFDVELFQVMRGTIDIERAGLCEKLQKLAVWSRPFDDNGLGVRKADFGQNIVHIHGLRRSSRTQLGVQRDIIPPVLEIGRREWRAI